jgi:hypothetical protein
MSAVVLVSGSSMADAVGGIGRSYRSAFTDLGFDFIYINLLDKERSVVQLNELIHTDIALVFSFMAMGTDIKAETKNGKECDMWEALRVPYISLYADSPSYYFDRHVLKPGNVALYGFPEQYALRKRLPHINGPIATYSPVAIDAVRREEIDFRRKSEGTLIFLKNGNDPKKLKSHWAASLSPKINAILMELAAELEARINDRATTQIDDLVTSYFADHNVDVEPLVRMRLFLIAQLDDYLRRLKSVLVAEALMDFPVLLHGNNWEHMDFSGKRLRYVPGGHFETSRTLIHECLGMIDMSPNTGLAPHDRALRSFGAHTLCLTNEQEFFARELPHSEDFFYRFDMDSIQSRVADVLTYKERYIEMGATVAAAFMQKFRPEIFAHQLLELAALTRFDRLPGLPEGMPNYFSWPPTKL